MQLARASLCFVTSFVLFAGKKFARSISPLECKLGGIPPLLVFHASGQPCDPTLSALASFHANVPARKDIGERLWQDDWQASAFWSLRLRTIWDRQPSELFAEEGAQVVADNSDLTEAGRCEALIAETGEIDVLVANLASPNFTGIAVTELADQDWHCTFDMMVHPLHRLCQAVVPQMIAPSGQNCRLRQRHRTQRHANGHRLQCSPCRTGRIHTIPRGRDSQAQRAGKSDRSKLR